MNSQIRLSRRQDCHRAGRSATVTLTVRRLEPCRAGATPGPDRLPVRQAESHPLVTQLRSWFEAQITKLPVRSTTAEAIRWRRMLETGAVGTVREFTAKERIRSSYVSWVLRLPPLAPAIVEAILDGRQPEEVTLPKLMEMFPVEWGEQVQALPD
jgi:hypothetical protein